MTGHLSKLVDYFANWLQSYGFFNYPHTNIESSKFMDIDGEIKKTSALRLFKFKHIPNSNYTNNVHNLFRIIQVLIINNFSSFFLHFCLPFFLLLVLCLYFGGIHFSSRWAVVEYRLHILNRMKRMSMI